MRIELNGKPAELADTATLAEAALAAGAPESRRGGAIALDGEGRPPPGRGVAIALDGEVVPRSEWGTTRLREGAAVEVLAAIQGGAETWTLGDREWSSRLIAGTGGFRSLAQMAARPPARAPGVV